MNDQQSLWKTHKLNDSGHSTWSIGDLQVYAKSYLNEIWIASQKLNEDLDDELQWSRWSTKKDINSVKISPSFPDRSVVITPETPFWLLPSVQSRIYVRIPVWMSVRLPDKDNRILSEVPTTTLSLTWFGNPTEGELCYWISSSAKREAQPDSERAHLILCPLQLKNTSDDDLLVEKICLRVKWLSIYEQQGQLWSNEMKVSFRGHETASSVSVTSGPPQEAPQAIFHTTAQETFKKSSAIRTFLEL